jgi:sodium/potassium-transporting ATPase subunit alpha
VEKSHPAGPLTLYIKGAPERVLGKCNTFLKNGEQVPITEEFRKEYDEAYDVKLVSFVVRPSLTSY